MYLTDGFNADPTIDHNTIICLSRSVMNICHIEAGSPCLVATTNVTTIKFAFLIENQSFTSVYFSKRGKCIMFCFIYLFIKFNIRNE